MTNVPAASSPVLEFVEIARNFCTIVSEHETKPAAQFLQQVHLVLPRLYAVALLLPSAGAESPDCEAPSKHAALWSSLRKQLGELDAYREIFDPYEPADGPPVVGSLADDISDIYAEIAGALQCWDAGNRDGAVWTWRNGFQYHWGRHLTSALRALYSSSVSFDS
jgi:hypothetical protein